MARRSDLEQRNHAWDAGTPVRATYFRSDGTKAGHRKATIISTHGDDVTVEFKNGEQQTKHFSWVIIDY